MLRYERAAGGRTRRHGPRRAAGEIQDIRTSMAYIGASSRMILHDGAAVLIPQCRPEPALCNR